MNDTSAVGQGMNTAANMLGVKKISISSHFNEQRTKHDGSVYGHGGIDVPMTAGSPIRMDDYGIDWTVSRVGNDPGGYGNFVEATGILYGRDGKEHHVKMLWAHMGDNTIPLQVGQKIRHGDFIGKVGNTGNSRGKNGGYHLHLETWLDNKRTDPLKFRESVWDFIQHTKSRSQSSEQATNVSALRDSQPTAQETPQTTTQGQTKSDVTAWVNEYDPAVYIETSDRKSYSKNEIEQIAKAQGLTLEQWLKKNNVQSYPDWGLPAFMENVRKWVPTDPVVYMSDQYGNYLTQDEFQREAARKNISADVYENQLRAQGFRKSGEDFSNDTAAAPVTALSDSQSVPPFPVNYRDHNRRNFATHTAENPKAGVAPAWSLADWLNRYTNTENTMRPPAEIQPEQNTLYHIPGFNVSGNPFSAMLPAVAQGGGGNQAQFITSALGHPILGDFSNIYGTGNITGNDIFRVMPPFSVLTPENYRRFYGLP